MFRGLLGLGAIFVLGLPMRSAWADDFMAECQMASTDVEPAKACACLSEKVTGPVRADAIAALHSLNTSKEAKPLPPDQQKGLDAVTTAKRFCR
jgi:hypothetical protein